MANVRDSDTSLWLHNKLGTSNDSWTGSSICSQLNAEVLRNIKDCFPDLQTQVKLKLLLSFFHIPRRNVEEWRSELEEIIEVASLDSELWVSMLSEAMKTFPSTGSLNTDISDLDDHRPIFGDLVNDLRKLLKKQHDPAMLPLECHYLNKTALISVVGQQPAPTKHFTLKRKPKSAALRAELLQKSIDAANNLKKSTAPTVPVRSRGMPRKMTDTTPLKGIPSRVPTSGFRSPALTPSIYTRTPISNRIRKDGGIKLLDINEQPLGYAQAKKRKRMLELEEQQKKVAEAQSAATAITPQNSSSDTLATPEYAQGLTAINPAVTTSTTSTQSQSNAAASTTIVSNTNANSATVISPVSVSTLTTTSISTPAAINSISTNTPKFEQKSTAVTTVISTITTAATITTTSIISSTTESVQTVSVPAVSTLTTSSTPTTITAITTNTNNASKFDQKSSTSTVTEAAPAVGVQPVRPAQTVTQIRIQTSAQPANSPSNTRKGLSLTREQMLEAQDMFRSANKVTRPEKALILGFMAGARTNPCPKLGNIVTVMLSENVEDVQQSDGTTVSMLVETHFQMNYTNGEWKRIKKNRRVVTENSGVSSTSVQSVAATASN